MRSLALRACLAVAGTGLGLGCGPAIVAPLPYTPKYPLPLLAAAVPADTPLYEIYYADQDVPLATYGITTGGRTWSLLWQADAVPQRFSGDIYCPRSCVLDSVLLAGERMAAPSPLEPNHLHFDIATAASTQLELRFEASLQPLSFFLFIDGQPATLPQTVFPWRGLSGSPSRMPFSLLSGPF